MLQNSKTSIFNSACLNPKRNVTNIHSIHIFYVCGKGSFSSLILRLNFCVQPVALLKNRVCMFSLENGGQLTYSGQYSLVLIALSVTSSVSVWPQKSANRHKRYKTYFPEQSYQRDIMLICFTFRPKTPDVQTLFFEATGCV